MKTYTVEIVVRKTHTFTARSNRQAQSIMESLSDCDFDNEDIEETLYDEQGEAV